MKKLISAILITAFAGVSLTAGEGKSLKVDKKASTVKWKGTKVTGEHYGTIDIKDASLTFKDGKLSGATVIIDMTSIVNTDLEDPGYNKKLVGHLKSDDFFSVEKYPDAKFVLTEVKSIEGDKYKISGDLTIKGITKPVSFESKINKSGEGYAVKGTLVFDRSKYNVRYGSGSFFDDLGDNLIHDDVELTFDLLVK